AFPPRHRTTTRNTSCCPAARGTPDFFSQTGPLPPAPTLPPYTTLFRSCADTTFELSEAFTVKLSGATNATITKDTGTGTIVNDDTAPTLRSEERRVGKECTGRTAAFPYTVTKTGATYQ